MARYLLSRLAGMILVLLVVSFITFALMYNAPGGPYQELNQPLSAEAKANITRKYGLDKPFYQNWWDWLTRAVRGDFGISYFYPNTKVLDLFWRHWGSSLMLGFLSVAWSFPLGALLGVVAALKRNTLLDQAITTFALISVTLPQISLIVFGVAVFIVWLGWFNLNNGLPLYAQPPNMWVLPAILFGFNTLGALMRYTRSGMLDVLSQEYIRTARAKGLGRARVILKHALRNMLIPLVTVFGPVLANALTGSIFVEIAFAIPGIGRFFLESIYNRDYPVIVFTVIITATIVSTTNLLIDLSYALIDPRVRLGGRHA
ncbi:MAG: ABC transporter permease [Anaerolineae bacterium]|nr:ABC transporter permease [Thermoflexales bacterium]MDW8292729.1 ABC transporter permease [Anaerolineae bacterium]